MLTPLRQARADLQAWLDKPEPEFRWELVETTPMPGCEIHKLRVHSQVWQNIPWSHDIVVFVPKDATESDQMLLLNEGGSANARSYPYGLLLASKVKIPCAMLLGIPNQPLLDGKREDALIAETFVRYLDTGDATWPLLFPMVKGVVKGMDALQAFSEKHLSRKTSRFILTGGSKRGWTTYLTAASDARISAIAPVVFDSLNLARQLPHQLETFGAYSEMIKDYTSRGLVPMPDTDAARKLWSWVDPWSFRARLTMPKLIVAGNNDPFWNTDALNLYWDGLPGEKWIAYSPNAGHNLRTMGPDGRRGDPLRAVNSLCAFVRRQITGDPMPVLDWKHDEAPGGELRLTVNVQPAPRSATLWTATAEGRDFRKSEWKSTPVTIPAEGAIAVTVPPPSSGGLAFYLDCGYEQDGIPWFLCTQMRVATAAKQ